MKNETKKQYFLALQDDQHSLSSITPIIHFNVDHEGCRIFGRSKINWPSKTSQFKDPTGLSREYIRKHVGKNKERPLYIPSILISFPWHRLKIIKISFTTYDIPQESVQRMFGSKHLSPHIYDRFFFFPFTIN